MCIKTITAYQDSKGGMYRDEPTALIAEAAIITNGSLPILQSMFGHAAALIPLFQRYAAVQAATAKAEAPDAKPTTISAEDHRKDCGLHRGFACDCPLSPSERRGLLLGRIQEWAQTERGKAKAKVFISSGGYENLPDLNTRATEDDIEKMHAELTALGVE